MRAINRARRQYGLAPLRHNPRLAFIAERHSLDLARHRRMSHSSRDGTPFQRRVRYVVPARRVGETIAAFRGRSTSRGVVRAWMASPPHRYALLTPGFRRVGVGVVRRGRLRVVTADFASAR